MDIGEAKPWLTASGLPFRPSRLAQARVKTGWPWRSEQWRGFAYPI